MLRADAVQTLIRAAEWMAGLRQRSSNCAADRQPLLEQRAGSSDSAGATESMCSSGTGEELSVIVSIPGNLPKAIT